MWTLWLAFFCSTDPAGTYGSRLYSQYGLWLSVMPGQLSVRNGPAGRPAPLNNVAAGFDCQAYRTSFGLGTEVEETTIDLPSTRASAQYHLRSSPAISNSTSFGPFTTRPPSVWERCNLIAPAFRSKDLSVGPEHTTCLP